MRTCDNSTEHGEALRLIELEALIVLTERSTRVCKLLSLQQTALGQRWGCPCVVCAGSGKGKCERNEVIRQR
jgi:hypothetical protein